jgi:threonine dehydratase
MTQASKDVWLAGVDGCKGGWIVVFASTAGAFRPARVVTHFEDIVAEAPAIIAVDVPIGLPQQSPVKGRLAENAVRPLLGDRKSSVFRIPSRSAVYASVASEPADARERFFHACKIARETSDDGKAFAKQGFYILDKVVQVDTFLRGNSDWINRVFETHPELSFVTMNDGAPLTEPKKLKNANYPAGLTLRRDLLGAAGIPRALLEAKPPKGAADDDMIDACACLVTAMNIHACKARPHPDPVPRDEFGLPMAIWA